MCDQMAVAQKKDSSNTLFEKLNESGFSFGASESLEGYGNFSGGIKRGNAYASTLDANMNIDLSKLFNGRSVGTFYADLEYHTGNNPTSLLIGDVQVFDKHNAAPFFQMLEFWYQQEFFRRKLRIKIGKIDANSEFSVIDNGLEFINSSTQVTPTLIVFPTFPDPVPAVNVFFTASKSFYTHFGVDDANQRGKFLNFYGDPVSVQPTSDGLLFISESGFSWNSFPWIGHDGNIKLGLWKHNGTFKTWKGDDQRGTEGLYLIFDQTLWRAGADDNSPGLYGYWEYAVTDSSVSPVHAHFGGGLVWDHTHSKKMPDMMGFGAHYVSLSPGLHTVKRSETNVEAFYRFDLTSWFSVKADMQHIFNPGGQYKDATVGTILFNFSIGQ